MADRDELAIALIDAVAAWRETRDPELADVVDQLAARCRHRVAPANKDFHAWWVAQAQQPYDPAIVATLVECSAIRLRSTDASWTKVQARWPDNPVIAAVGNHPGTSAGNWLERLAAIASWPDDPQVAALLASWLTSPHRVVSAARAQNVYRALADRLISLGDRRVLPRLQAALAEPSPREALIADVVAALELQPSAPDPRTARWRDLVAVPSESDRLWAEVAGHPDALAPRSVLADALLAREESRGELIALQLAIVDRPAPNRGRDPRGRRTGRLIGNEWERWLGDLALLVLRDAAAFRAGMLEVIRVGFTFTPRWVWTAVRGHRELACVHTVRPAIAPGAEYARFVAALPHLRTLNVPSAEAALALAALDAMLAVTRLEYPHASLDTLDLAARIAPRATTLALDADATGEAVRDLAIAAPAWFPQLHTIEVCSGLAAQREWLQAELAGVPLVQIGTPIGTPAVRSEHA